MRKFLIAAASIAALGGAAGLALAADGPQHSRGPGGMVFQSDANNDGVVTRQEFDANRAATFARLDANNDGQLTREEMRAGRPDRGGRGHGRRHGGMHSFAGADANNDGNITREEFLARPTQMFDRLDANHDGVIQASERPQRPERSQGEARQRANPDANGDHQLSQAEWTSMGASMFERLDANHDGRITREEADAARPHRGGGR
jgi:Ca2+-binding EF-hand superfamily protein